MTQIFQLCLDCMGPETDDLLPDGEKALIYDIYLRNLGSDKLLESMIFVTDPHPLIYKTPLSKYDGVMVRLCI